MRTYDSTYRPHKAKLSRARRVDISRIALNTLRQAKAPINVRDIMLRVMAARGKKQADTRSVQAMIKGVRAVLGGQRKNGTIRSIERPVVLWEVA